MKKIVRVIKLEPGEAVLIVAENKPAPCPCCGACMVENNNSNEDISLLPSILVCLDDAA